MADTSTWNAFLVHSFLKEVGGKTCLVTSETIDDEEYLSSEEAWAGAEKLLKSHEDHRIESVTIGIRPSNYVQPQKNISRRKN